MTAAFDGEILFLAHRIPFPPDRGDKIRSHHLLKALVEIAPVHIGCFADDARDLGFAEEVQLLTQSQCVVMRNRSELVAGVAGLLKDQPMLVSMYESAQLHRWVKTLLRERPIKTIVVFSVQMAHYVPHDLPEGTRFLMDFVDFDSAKYAAYGAGEGGLMGWINRREGRKLMAFERDVALRADVSTFVSDAEAELFARMAGVFGANIQTLENGININYFNDKSDISKIGYHDFPLLLFTGQMDYRPNIEAVTSFTKDVFPAIRSVFPSSVFAIAGRNPAPQVRALEKMPGVRVVGAVDDMRPWLAAADVVVAPLRAARGVQNKVLEAMAMGRPVVASALAAEGIDAVDGEHLVVSHSIEEEAKSVIALLKDPERARQMGQAARQWVERRYDWRKTLAPLREMLSGATS